MKKNKEPTGGFVIKNIVYHRGDTTRRHRYARALAQLYRVHWYGYETNYDTWEATRLLPRDNILSYFRKKRRLIPDRIHQAENG